MPLLVQWKQAESVDERRSIASIIENFNLELRPRLDRVSDLLHGLGISVFSLQKSTIAPKNVLFRVASQKREIVVCVNDLMKELLGNRNINRDRSETLASTTVPFRITFVRAGQFQKAKKIKTHRFVGQPVIRHDRTLGHCFHEGIL